MYEHTQYQKLALQALAEMPHSSPSLLKERLEREL